MKIGLLTYHAVCNFGANLQALSTLNYWINQGHDAIFINWVPKQLEDRYHKSTPIQQFEEHKRFREKYFPMTRRCYTDKDIVEVVKEEHIDAIVVGSDAVMQTRPVKSRLLFPTRRLFSIIKPYLDTTPPNPFWGSYYSSLEKKIPLIYMSASSQNSPYFTSNQEEKSIQKDLLLQYRYISTRDAWTAKMVNWITDGIILPSVTPDPVFAFNYNVSDQPAEEEIRKKFGLSKRYCLVSFHNDKAVSLKWLAKMQKKMSERKVECIAFPFPKGITFKHPFSKQIDTPLSPLDWYSLIKYADYYIGDNMHPIVVCLHNAVPCFSFDHYGITKFFRIIVNHKSSKIYHILDKYGLLNNRVSLLGFYKSPSVNYVLEQLDKFDKTHVRNISNNQLTEYKAMMHEIEDIISQNK